MHDVANDLEASWNFDTLWQQLLQNFLVSKVLVVQCQLVLFVDCELLVGIILLEVGRAHDAALH